MTIESVGNKCCGCRVCQQVCKLQAIKFTSDKYGFEYPSIDYNICVKCGLCEKTCPIINKPQLSNVTFGGMAYSLDSETKHNGSSGGLFGVFAKNIINQNGIVFGAAFDENLKLKTQKAKTFDELIPLYKSKYLLCDTQDSFSAIETELKRGRLVLYCSSPCQIAALKLYLNKEYDNLLAIDFVCHGVGSQTLFDRSISYTESKEKIQIKKVILRYKKNKASSHYYYFYYLKDNKFHEKIDLYFSFPYYNAYCKQLVCRDSCYDCKFASRSRAGDITVGDFHSIEKYYPKIDRFAGVSMLMINTPKGQKYFDSVRDRIYFQKMDKEIPYKNNRFSDEVIIPKQQPEFRKSVATEPFGTTVKRFLKPSKDWKKLIYYNSPKIIRKIIMKMR
ncbi:MAG: Coenzyme F420 hydrogenase/dehydrogenase, beta subunit C-terminal domain [Clostridia bacterium]|nr:Coenzyme F420 hydrogenase/dehydrogenase, beta subunit C-terminal domain [Clostridia bacterium]